MAKEQIRIVTDTSTIAIFDPEALVHCLERSHDWWTWWPDVLPEVNQGHLALADLGADGVYSVTVTDKHNGPEPCKFKFCLLAPSRQLYIGGGEDITADGLEPDGTTGGRFLSIDGDCVVCQMGLLDGDSIFIDLRPCKAFSGNRYTDPIRLRE